jgi:hypothetical protein
VTDRCVKLGDDKSPDKSIEVAWDTEGGIGGTVGVTDGRFEGATISAVVCDCGGSCGKLPCWFAVGVTAAAAAAEYLIGSVAAGRVTGVGRPCLRILAIGC